MPSPLSTLHGSRAVASLGWRASLSEMWAYPSMSRIVDYSSLEEPETTFDHARALLMGRWVTIPDDLHSEAEGRYMIDLVVAA